MTDYRRSHTADPATEHEARGISLSVQPALEGIRRARLALRDIRLSDDVVKVLGALERAQEILERSLPDAPARTKSD